MAAGEWVAITSREKTNIDMNEGFFWGARQQGGKGLTKSKLVTEFRSKAETPGGVGVRVRRRLLGSDS